MVPKKRPFGEMADSDGDDEPSMGRQTLPVARLPADFSGEPMDGMQYLFMVRRAAEKLPFVTRAANPYKNNTAVKASSEVKPRTAYKSQLPSEEWRANFVKRFKNFRKNTLQRTIGVQLPFIPSEGSSKRMPEWNERDNWWAYINGRPEYEWDPPKRPKKKRRVWNAEVQRYVRSDDVDQYEVTYSNAQETAGSVGYGAEPLVMNKYSEVAEDGEVEETTEIKVEEGVEVSGTLLPTPLATPQPEVRCKVAEHRPPTMTLLTELDNRFALKLLQFFAHWMNRYLDSTESPQLFQQLHSPRYITQGHARWIFALLSRVDDHLLSDELNELRNLARASVRYLKDIKKSSGDVPDEGSDVSARSKWVGDAADAPMGEAACWVIVTAVAEFWGQKDLWMDAEVAFR